MNTPQADDPTVPLVAGQWSEIRPSWWVRARTPAAVCLVVAAHAIANGWVMVRGGVGGYSVSMVTISVAVVLLAGTAAAAAAEVWPEPAGGWREVLPARPGYVVLGAAVAVLVPLMWGAGDGQGALPPGITVWLYALPWGAGIAAVGWLRGRAAVVAGATVVVSAVVCAVFVAGIHIAAYYATPPPAD